MIYEQILQKQNGLLWEIFIACLPYAIGREKGVLGTQESTLAQFL